MVAEFLLENIYFFYSLISAVVFLVLVLGDWNKKKVAYIHGLVSAWSGFIYLNFVLEIFPVVFTPYLDWIISTPLIVLAFGLSVKDSVDTELFITIFAQFLTIAFGIAAFVYGSNVFFVLSSFSMIVALIYIYRITFEEYPRLFVFLAASWIGYPLIYVYTDGNLVEATIPLVVLPLMSKHVFSLLHLYLTQK